MTEGRVQRFRFDIEPMGAVRTTRRQLHVDKAAIRYRDWKEYCRAVLVWEYRMTGEPTRAAIGIPRIVFHMPLTKNATKNGKRPGDFHTYTPDTDNLIKAIFDVFNGIFWHDDCQVCHIGEVQKIYGDEPGIEIDVVELF